MIKWEYKQVQKLVRESELNELGKEGWELITILVQTYKTLSNDYVFTFKRRLKKRSSSSVG